MSGAAADRFERFELKYLISAEQRPELRRFLAPWVQADEHTRTLSYPTTNLYFDSPERTLYWAHVRSEIDRYKLRVRRYGDGDRCSFEVKRKIRDVILKHRSVVPCADFLGVLDGDRAVIDASSKPEYLDEWISRSLLIGAEPVVYIRYLREAYRGIFDEGCRITIDAELSYQPATEASLSPPEQGFMPFDGAESLRGVKEACILEIKFNRYFPAWVHELGLRFDLQRVQLSKYLLAVEHERARWVDPLPRSTMTRFELPAFDLFGRRGSAPLPDREGR